MLPLSVLHAKEMVRSSWQRLETRHTILFYFGEKDLKKFDRQVEYSAGAWSFKKLFPSTKSANVSEELEKKVDALYERVQGILDMRKGMEKVSIRILRNAKQFHSVFYENYGKPCRLKAWYAYDHNSIYLNLSDVHEGILAHELAHSIVDHYLIVRPPRATAEILARYVDAHLFD